MLNGILDEGLQKDHIVKRHPGATTRDVVEYVRPVIRKKRTVYTGVQITLRVETKLIR